MNKNWWQDEAQHEWEPSWQDSSQVDWQDSWQESWQEDWQQDWKQDWYAQQSQHKDLAGPKSSQGWQDYSHQEWEEVQEEEVHPGALGLSSYNYSAPLSSEHLERDQEDLRRAEAPLHPDSLEQCYHKYYAPVSSEQFAEDPYHWEKASTNVEVLDDDEPEERLSEESDKLLQFFASYQEEQEEEVKHYTDYVEEKSDVTGSYSAASSSSKVASNPVETTSVFKFKKHAEKEDVEFEAEKSGWFNHCTVLIALWQMNRVKKMHDIMQVLANHPKQKDRVMLLKSHIQKYGDSGPKRLGYKF